MTTTPNTEPPGQAPGSSVPQGQEPNSNGQAPNEPQNSNVSLEDLQKQIAELRRENASHRRKAKEQEDAATAAEQARLAEQGQFKELASKHEQRVKELEPKAVRFEAMSERIRKQIQAATKDWPQEIKAFYPGDDADIDQIQDWYDRSQPLLAKMQEQARSTLPGNRPNPAPANAAESRQRLLEANRQAFRQQRNYGI